MKIDRRQTHALRTEAKIESALSPRFFSSVLHPYCSDQEYSQVQQAELYLDINQYLHVMLFGLDTASLRTFLDLHGVEKTRDSLPEEALELINQIEDLAGTYIKIYQSEPLSALEISCEHLVRHIIYLP